MSANVGKTVWMKSPSEDRLQRKKAVTMGADVTSETREPILTNPLASSWGPPQAPDLIAIFVSMLYLFGHICFNVTQEWMRLALLLLSLPSFVPLLSWVLGFGLCLTQNQWVCTVLFLCSSSNMQKPSPTILCKIWQVPWQYISSLYMIYPWRLCSMWTLSSLLPIIIYASKEQGSHLLCSHIYVHKGVHLYRNKF